MAYFTKEFFQFFDQLKKNNNKEWFDAHRSEYESHVKQPFKKFVEEMIEALGKEHPEINRNPSKAIFRINRDIRFSKNKEPYKNNVAAVFTVKGTTDMDHPGFYIHIGSEEIMAGGGAYMLTKENLEKVRQEIFYNPDVFKKLITNKKFVQYFGGILGDKNKVLPPDYKAFAAEQPLIANKQFYFMANLTRDEVLSNDLKKQLLLRYAAAAPLKEFLWQAIRS